MAEEKKQALISISSGVHGEGDAREDAVHLITSGVFIKEGDEKYRLCYDEIMDESLPAQHVTLTFSEGTVSMDRDGEYRSNLVFARGARYEGQYTTPYGDMDMAVYCTKLSYLIDDEGGEMSLQYQLDLGGQFAAMRDMRLQFSLRDGA